MTERESQCKAIIRYMEEVGPITSRIASRELDCDRLASRICDLRHDGVPVQDGWDYKLDEHGKVLKKWKRYWLPDVHMEDGET